MLSFFWPKFSDFGPKVRFCYRTPDFVNGPFVTLAKAVDLPPSDPFFDFLFPRNGRFREGDPPTRQKVLPHLTVGALTDSNSPSALSLRAGKSFKFWQKIDKPQLFLTWSSKIKLFEPSKNIFN